MNKPDPCYWGEQTQGALELFGKGPIPARVIKALAQVKKAAVKAQISVESPYPQDFEDSLLQACDEIIAGNHNDQFPLNLRMGSAGTSLHMNINEVLCNRANELYRKAGGTWQAHFLDDINRYQSTNDVLPTALSILLVQGLNRIEQEVILLQEALVERENRYDGILILGRTELQDALPMKLGQIFAAWAGGVERDRWRINKLKERCRTIALGGTALGTCFSAPREYIFAAEKQLRQITALPLSRSQNLCDEVALQDKTAEVMGGLGLCGDNLFKMTGDLLLYSSSLSGEITHAHLIYGSTIMAGKSNPVLLEYIQGLSVEVRAQADMVIRHCREGQLQLNARLPFIISGFLKVCDDLEVALKTMTDKLLPSMQPDLSTIDKKLYGSSALIQALKPWLSYDKIKEIFTMLKQQEHPPRNKESWILFLQEVGGLTPQFLETQGFQKSFLQDFLNSPGLTGFYRKEL